MFSYVPAPKENRNLPDAMQNTDWSGENTRITEARATELGEDQQGVMLLPYSDHGKEIDLSRHWVHTLNCTKGMIDSIFPHEKMHKLWSGIVRTLP